jgi:glycerate 2-kinase
MKNAHLLDIFSAALEAVEPSSAVSRILSLTGDRVTVASNKYDLASYDRILVIGAGKATARMALSIEKLFHERIAGGLIIVKYGHTAPLRFIQQREAGHPIPDQAGVDATREIIGLLQKADERTLVICLISGGGSALLAAPAKGITLQEKQQATDLLMKAGATINELNAVRKHLSAVKGGRLARMAAPATIMTLLISDVINDHLDVIASGPTAPDSTTFTEAISVVKKYGLQSSMPQGIISFLERGVAGREEETTKEHDPCFARTQNAIAGSLRQALFAAQEKARTLGMSSELVSGELQGEARVAARFLAEKAVQTRNRLKDGERFILLAGGETTVTVTGTGRGGRNQELALVFAREIAGEKGITLLSAGTDGTDGPTDAAGAFVDGDTVPAAKKFGLDPALYLENNDSYTFFERLDALSEKQHHLKTGPTGTNVMDLQIMLLEKSGEFEKAQKDRGARSGR